MTPSSSHAAGASLGTIARHAVGWIAHHTGLPALLVAAILIVLSWRVFKRSVRLVVEVAVALALLLIATRCGWISW